MSCSWNKQSLFQVGARRQCKAKAVNTHKGFFFPLGSSTSLSSLFLTQIASPIWLLRWLTRTRDTVASRCGGHRLSSHALARWPRGKSQFTLQRCCLQGVEHLNIAWNIWELQRALGAGHKSLLVVPDAAWAGWRRRRSQGSVMG